MSSNDSVNAIRDDSLLYFFRSNLFQRFRRRFADIRILVFESLSQGGNSRLCQRANFSQRDSRQPAHPVVFIFQTFNESRNNDCGPGAGLANQFDSVPPVRRLRLP